jgi:hypothetical protein
MMAKIKLGVMVQIISITFPCTTFTKLFFSCLNRTATLKSKYNTKIQIMTRKNITSWWRSTIPSIIGVAGSWNPNCHGCTESQVDCATRCRRNLIIISDIERVFLMGLCVRRCFVVACPLHGPARETHIPFLKNFTNKFTTNI